MERYKIWIEKCVVARRVKDAFGTESAFDYLVAENLLAFARAAERSDAVAGELPCFIAEIHRILTPTELSVCTKRLGLADRRRIRNLLFL